MEYQKIHACPNDCILYRKEFKTLTKCPRCGVSQYKVKDDDDDEDNMKKGPLAKVLWYLPIIPRFKRLFANVDDAKNFMWHANGRKSDGLLRHVVDSPQWKKIDTLYDVIPTRLIPWATPRPKSCSRPNTWSTCTFKPKPIKRLNNKEHAKKYPIGLHSRWPKPTWASHTLHMGQRRCEDSKRCLKEQ